METLESRQRLYDAIKDVRDSNTRFVLYSQFIHKYYPEAFDVVVKNTINNVCYKSLNSSNQSVQESQQVKRQ
jgi:hypothetical protein